jgi:hypothetical protein
MPPPDAAAKTGLSVQRLAKMRLDGTGPAYVKAGRSIRYLPEDLDAWLQANRRRSTSDIGIAA